MSEVNCHETQYGFVFGAATVERTASHKGHVIIAIKTPREQMHIRITPSGLIRIGGKKTRGE